MILIILPGLEFVFFVYRSHLNVFHPEILHTYTYILVYLHKFFQIFFKPKSLNFEIFKKKASMEAESQTSILPAHTWKIMLYDISFSTKDSGSQRGTTLC